MLKSATSPGDAVTQQRVPTPDEIRRQLRAILTSPSFLGSKRSQQFLEYVCEKSLQGQGGHLKERTIAIEVFGRAPESDLGEDTIVRVSAREVRKRLAQYYSNADPGDLRIDLPSGAYAPDFHYAAVAPAPVPPAVPPPPVVESPPPKRKRRWALVAAPVIAVLAATFFLYRGEPNAQAFQLFWEPVFNAHEPLLVAVAHPIVYHAAGRAQKLSHENLPPQDNPLQRPIQVPPEQLNGNDFVPVFNQYVGFGDMVVATEVSSMLATRSKTIRLRLASNLEFADLRRQPALLIGAVTNRWTVELQHAWRYRFDYTPGAKTVITGDGREWSIPSKDDGSTLDDYLMICRIRSASTGGLVLVAAGLKQFGTEAAGRLLADPEQLGPILRKLPPGWESKNLQLVLHARVIGNTPAQPEIVATNVC